MRQLALIALCLVIAAAVTGCGGSGTPPLGSGGTLTFSPGPNLPKACRGTHYSSHKCDVAFPKQLLCTSHGTSADSHSVCQTLFVLGPARNPNPLDRLAAWIYRTLIK